MLNHIFIGVVSTTAHYWWSGITLADVIALLGVITTTFFNYLLWIATKSASQTARATLELSKQLSDRESTRQEEYNRAMKKVLAIDIWRESEKAYKAVVDTDGYVIMRKLVKAPRELSINTADILAYFNNDESQVIIEVWDTYKRFRDKIMDAAIITGDSIVFANESTSVLKDAEPVIFAFNSLENMIKKYL